MFEGTSDNSILKKHANTQAQAFMFCIFNLQYLSKLPKKSVVFISPKTRKIGCRYALCLAVFCGAFYDFVVVEDGGHSSFQRNVGLDIQVMESLAGLVFYDLWVLFLGGTAQHKWAVNQTLVICCSTGDGTTQLYSGIIS